MSGATYVDANILDAFKSRVNVFVADALKHMGERCKAPRFGRPQYLENEKWRFVASDDEALVKESYRSTWLQMYLQPPIIETLGLLELVSFQNLLELVESKPELRFLLWAHRGFHHSHDEEDSAKSLLVSSVEYELIRELVDESRSFEFLDGVFETAYGKFQEKLLNPFIRRISTPHSVTSHARRMSN